MIISIGAVDTVTTEKLLRPSREMAPSKITHYLSEFLRRALDSEGVIEGADYDFVYATDGSLKFFIQASKDASHRRCVEMLKYIMDNSARDMLDILITIDALLYNSELIKIDLQSVKKLDSQEEKIYNMMIENKQMEIRQREKEHRRAICNEEAGIPVAEQAPVDPQRRLETTIEKSEKPVLVVIKERLKVLMDKDNYIKENSISGEMSMVISDARYLGVQLRMRNMMGGVKYSPYLDKEAVRQGVLRFNKEKGVNKLIPLLKWSAKAPPVPLSMETWMDEEGDKYVNVFEVKAKSDVDHLEIRLNKAGVSGAETGDAAVEELDWIVWRVGSLAAGETRTCEIKYHGQDSNSLFPMELTFSRRAVESKMDVDGIEAEGVDEPEWEVRRLTEVDMFKIVAE